MSTVTGTLTATEVLPAASVATAVIVWVVLIGLVVLVVLFQFADGLVDRISNISQPSDNLFTGQIGHLRQFAFGSNIVQAVNCAKE